MELEKSLFLCVSRGLDFNKIQELLVAMSPLLSRNEKIKSKMQMKGDWEPMEP